MSLIKATKMNDIKNTGFTSYLDESELESVTLSDLQKTKLLDGETLVAEAQKVFLFAPLSDHKKGTLGILTVTTFKLAFACANEDDFESSYQQNMLLGPYEVCLSSIDTIYQVGDKSKKKLVPGQNVSGKVKELLIICKNMRTFEFSFKDSDKDSGRTIANSLLHHAFPKRHSLLFAYEYAEPYFKSGKDVRTFRKPEDWRLEMERTRCQLWRISLLNQNFVVSPTLCEAFVVPSSVTDSGLTKAVEHFRNRSCPVWVWSAPSGAALVRMSDILPTITDRTQENVMLEHVRKSHAEKRQPHIMDLSRECPTPKEIQSSYLKLRDLCTPESIKMFKIQDYKFYGLLESTKWLQHVSTCLTKAAEGAELICNPEPTTVVLQEYSGQDMNCVVSSLIQLLLDPNWRTVYGFQTLIQKEWVALGHPFTNRLGHILSPDIEAAPLFLIFLDCVWQLLQQFPTAFQFTETYLTTLWDSAHVTAFDTFLFNCEHDRSIARAGPNPLILRSVWDWKEQFNDKDIVFFCNPLFDDSFPQRIIPNTSIKHLEVWLQCYFRWLPDLEIPRGGKPQIDICNRIVASEIYMTRQKLSDGSVNGNLPYAKDEYLQLMRNIGSFFPFSRNNIQSTDLFPINNSLLNSSDMLDTQSIFNQSIANE